MTVPSPRGHRGDQLVSGKGLTVERLANDLAKGIELLRGDAEVTLPAGPLPRSSGGYQREERAGVLGRQQVQRAAHRPRLDESPVAERARHVAGLRSLAPYTNAKLGNRRDLRLDAAKTADDIRHGPLPHRVEIVPAHSPGEGLPPGHFRRHRASARRDVLVDPEEIAGVVLTLQSLQPVVLVRSVRLPNAIHAFVHEEVDIDAGVIRAQGRPEVSRPLPFFIEPGGGRRRCVHVDGAARLATAERAPILADPSDRTGELEAR